MKRTLRLFTIFFISLVCISFLIPKTVTYKLIVFEGSDWCTNCRRLENNILSDSTFKAYLIKNGIKIEKIDFPQRKKLSKGEKEYNSSIADKYNFQGQYPTILLARQDTLFYNKLNYKNESVAEMVKKIEQRIKTLK